MNRVKYVPADRKARVLAPSAILVIYIGQDRVSGRPLFNKGVDGFLRAPTAREADILATRRGWVRLSSLSPSERRDWHEAHRKGRKDGETQARGSGVGSG